MELSLKSMRGASGSADRRQPQLASQVVGRGTELDFRALGPNGLGSEVGEQQTGIGAVRKTNAPYV